MRDGAVLPSIKNARFLMLILSVKPDRQLNSNKISPFFVWPRYMITEQTIKDLMEAGHPKEILAKLAKMTASAKLTDRPKLGGVDFKKPWLRLQYAAATFRNPILEIYRC